MSTEAASQGRAEQIASAFLADEHRKTTLTDSTPGSGDYRFRVTGDGYMDVQEPLGPQRAKAMDAFTWLGGVAVALGRDPVSDTEIIDALDIIAEQVVDEQLLAQASLRAA